MSSNRNAHRLATKAAVAAAAAVVLWVAAAPAPADEGAASSFTATLDVKVLNFEVVVTDRDGQRVPGLTQADFTLFVDGQEMPVEYFTEVRDAKFVGAVPDFDVVEGGDAGTSFLTPDKMGNFQIGSDIVNFNGEKTPAGSLATCGFDDDGVKTTEWPIVKDGVFVDYQTTREQARWIGRERSHGTSSAQSWKDVAFQRMPNINMVPGPRPLSLDSLIGETDDATAGSIQSNR